MLINDCIKYVIDNIVYVTIEDFCQLTSRSRTAINLLIRKGNKQRKLKVLRTSSSKTFIPVSEYFEFPFSEGNKRNLVYNYTADGNIKFNEAINNANKLYDKKYKEISKEG
jgi:hypothetical protein